MNETFYKDVEELRKAGSGRTTTAWLGKWCAENFKFHGIDVSAIPNPEKINGSPFDKPGIYVDFVNVFANERSVPETGWSMFISMEAGLMATFKAGEPVWSIFYTERGEEWMAGMWVAPDLGFVATNRADENAPCKETLKWVSKTPENVLVMTAMDFLYGFSCKAG